MDSQTQQALIQVIDILEKTASEIRTLEAEAQEALHDHDDVNTYRKKLEQKTILLMDLHDRTWDPLEAMEENLREEIRASIENFAYRAEQAAENASLFYMYALLYPEDYKEGDKNDLENYTKGLRQKYLT
jgi:hypothetical protein